MRHLDDFRAWFETVFVESAVRLRPIPTISGTGGLSAETCEALTQLTSVDSPSGEAVRDQMARFLAAYLLGFERRDREPVPIRSAAGRCEARLIYDGLPPVVLSPEAAVSAVRVLAGVSPRSVVSPLAGAADLWDIVLFDLVVASRYSTIGAWYDVGEPPNGLSAVLPTGSDGRLSALVAADADCAAWMLSSDERCLAIPLLQRTWAALAASIVSRCAGFGRRPHDSFEEGLSALAGVLRDTCAAIISHHRYELLAFAVPIYLGLPEEAPSDVDRAWVELHEPLGTVLAVREEPMGDRHRESKRWLFEMLRSPVREALEARLESARRRTSIGE